LPLDKSVRHERQSLLENVLSRRAEKIKSLRGILHVRYARGLKSGKASLAVVLQKPDSLRMESFAEFGSTLFQMAVEKSTLIFYWPHEKKYFQGLATRNIMAEHLGIALDPNEVVNLLMADCSWNQEEDSLYQKKSSQWVLKGTSQEIIFEEKEGSILPFECTSFDVGGRPDYRVTYEDYTLIQKEWMPRKILMQFWDPKIRLQIQIEELEINPRKMDKTIFQLHIPDETKHLID